jgi:anti-anti-sigma factor
MSREFLAIVDQGVSVPGCTKTQGQVPFMDHLPGTATIHQTSPHARVVASGDFDISTMPRFVIQLDEAVAAGCGDFSLDLGGVTFCDASMAGMLAGFDRRLRDSNGTLRIVAASSPVRRIVRLVDLGRMLGPEIATA